MNPVDRIQSLLQSPVDHGFKWLDLPCMKRDIILEKYSKKDPLDFSYFLARIHSFEEGHWKNSAEAVLEFARWGWKSKDGKSVHCSDCNKIIQCDGFIHSQEAWLAVCRKSHRPYCRWSVIPSPLSFTEIPHISEKYLVRYLQELCEQLSLLGDQLPKFSQELLEELEIDKETMHIFFELSSMAEVECSISSFVLAVCGWVWFDEFNSYKCKFCQKEVDSCIITSIEDTKYPLDRYSDLDLNWSYYSNLLALSNSQSAQSELYESARQSTEGANSTDGENSFDEIIDELSEVVKTVESESGSCDNEMERSFDNNTNRQISWKENLRLPCDAERTARWGKLTGVNKFRSLKIKKAIKYLAGRKFVNAKLLIDSVQQQNFGNQQITNKIPFQRRDLEEGSRNGSSMSYVVGKYLPPFKVPDFPSIQKIPYSMQKNNERAKFWKFKNVTLNNSNRKIVNSFLLSKKVRAVRCLNNRSRTAFKPNRNFQQTKFMAPLEFVSIPDNEITVYEISSDDDDDGDDCAEENSRNGIHHRGTERYASYNNISISGFQQSKVRNSYEVNSDLDNSEISMDDDSGSVNQLQDNHEENDDDDDDDEITFIKEENVFYDNLNTCRKVNNQAKNDLLGHSSNDASISVKDCGKGESDKTDLNCSNNKTICCKTESEFVAEDIFISQNGNNMKLNKLCESQIETEEESNENNNIFSKEKKVPKTSICLIDQASTKYCNNIKFINNLSKESENCETLSVENNEISLIETLNAVNESKSPENRIKLEVSDCIKSTENVIEVETSQPEYGQNIKSTSEISTIQSLTQFSKKCMSDSTENNFCDKEKLITRNECNDLKISDAEVHCLKLDGYAGSIDTNYQISPPCSRSDKSNNENMKKDKVKGIENHCRTLEVDSTFETESTKTKSDLLSFNNEESFKNSAEIQQASKFVNNKGYEDAKDLCQNIGKKDNENMEEDIVLNSIVVKTFVEQCESDPSKLEVTETPKKPVYNCNSSIINVNKSELQNTVNIPPSANEPTNRLEKISNLDSSVVEDDGIKNSRKFPNTKCGDQTESEKCRENNLTMGTESTCQENDEHMNIQIIKTESKFGQDEFVSSENEVDSDTFLDPGNIICKRNLFNCEPMEVNSLMNTEDKGHYSISSESSVVGKEQSVQSFSKQKLNRKFPFHPINEHYYWCVWRIGRIPGWKQQLNMLRTGLTMYSNEMYFDEHKASFIQEILRINECISGWCK